MSNKKSDDDFYGITHITPAGGNIFEDLGFPPDEEKNFSKKPMLKS